MRQRLNLSVTIAVLCMLLVSGTLFNQTSRAASGPTLSVDLRAARHPISQDVYGITFWWTDNGSTKDRNERNEQIDFAKAIGLPVNRSGGDATTRYNWQLDSTNAGSDWFYIGGGNTNPTPGAGNDVIIDTNKTIGAKTVMTVPIIDFINKSKEWVCSFPKSIYSEQQSYNPYVHPIINGQLTDCGNGIKPDGTELIDTHVSDHDMPNSPDFQKGWIQHLVQKYGTTSAGGVQVYQLDNEPSGWLAVHRDVHPQGVGYTELRDRTVDYAAAIKSVDPAAETLGPGDIPYAYLGCNNCGNDGAAAHNNTQLGEWYLQQMAQYEKDHGVRILDYYAMHYPGCCGENLIGRAQERIDIFRGWIAKDYPGTKLAFDEYNWGDAKDFTNALLTADGLGLFGREQADLASYWGLDDVSWPTAYAFRMYRNYDGNGGGTTKKSIVTERIDRVEARGAAGAILGGFLRRLGLLKLKIAGVDCRQCLPGLHLIANFDRNCCDRACLA